MGARPPRILLIVFFFLALTFIFFFKSRALNPAANLAVPVEHVVVSPDALKGDVIMGKLGNETAKYALFSKMMRTCGLECLRAELGRAAWKLFHTTMARFPDKPSEDESEALRAYIHLFARLYPWYDTSISTSSINPRT
jgi:FAD-linked sulfhydryl oxidase